MKILLLLLTTAVAVPAVFLMREKTARAFAALVAAAQFFQVLLLARQGEAIAWQVEWLPQLGINLALALDGSNVLLLMLAPLLTCLALVFTGDSLPRQGEFSGLLLLMLTALQGLFLADNLGLFYFCFEVMLLPAILLTVRYGGPEGRPAALKFLLYTLAGSLPMLLGVMALATADNNPTMRSDLNFAVLSGLPADQQFWLLLLFALAFIIKIPLVPFHGWLPDLYKACPPQVTAVIAGVMSKAGAFGFVKVGLLVFPHGMARISEGLAVLAVVTVVYGGWCALGSDSVKGTLAYSSLSHMGMIALGIAAMNPAGLAGVNLQMFAHGLATGGLFLVVALLVRRGVPDRIDRLGGIGQSAPRLSVAFLFLIMASLGLPGLCGFPGELLILTGLYERSVGMTLVATLGIVFAGWYLLRLYQAVMHGPYGTIEQVEEIRGSEWLALLPLVVLVIMVGLNPESWSEPFVLWLEMLSGGWS